jgi:hypothetical protein
MTTKIKDIKTIKQLKGLIREQKERLRSIESTFREGQYWLNYLEFRLEQEQGTKQKIEYSQ